MIYSFLNFLLFPRHFHLLLHSIGIILWGKQYDMPWADPGFLERGFIICIHEGVALLILSHFSKTENPMKMIEIRLRPNYFIFMEYLGGAGGGGGATPSGSVTVCH